MTRGWKSTLLNALLCGVLASGTMTALGAPPPPAPTGTIYYKSTGSTINAVKADGTGHTLNVLPNYSSMTGTTISVANPALYRSGSNSTHDRWFIYPGITGVYDETFDGTTTYYDFHHYDLFAVRSNPANRSQLVTVQLTDLYGIANFNPGGAGSWSNDGNDGPYSFVTGLAKDLRGAYEEIEDPDTGEITTYVDTTLSSTCTPRVPLTLIELDAGGYVPISPDTISEAELDAVLAFHSISKGPGYQGVFSPDGSLCLRNNAPTKQLSIADSLTGNPVQLLWDGSTTAPNDMYLWQWSPGGLTIAFTERISTYTRGGHIWTQPANASSVPKKVLTATTSGSTKTSYEAPLWSPDSNYLMALKLRYSGTTLNGAWLTRVRLSDGAATDIVSISTASIPSMLRWTSNN